MKLHIFLVYLILLFSRVTAKPNPELTRSPHPPSQSMIVGASVGGGMLLFAVIVCCIAYGETFLDLLMCRVCAKRERVVIEHYQEDEDEP